MAYPLDQMRMTPDQIDRLETAAHQLNKHGNMVGVAIVKAIRGKTDDEKRSILVMAFAQAYESLLIMNLALNTTGSVKKMLEEREKLEE